MNRVLAHAVCRSLEVLVTLGVLLIVQLLQSLMA